MIVAVTPHSNTLKTTVTWSQHSTDAGFRFDESAEWCDCIHVVYFRLTWATKKPIV